MNNRSSGSRFEQRLARDLADNGFWVHVLQQNRAGQPADLIAVRGPYHTLIDCKVISSPGGFPLSRMEPNQRLAMRRFMSCGGEAAWFALRLPDGSVYMLDFPRALSYESTQGGTIPEHVIRSSLYAFDDWLSFVSGREQLLHGLSPDIPAVSAEEVLP